MDTYGTLESDQDVILLYDSINSKLFIVNYMAGEGDSHRHSTSGESDRYKIEF